MSNFTCKCHSNDSLLCSDAIITFVNRCSCGNKFRSNDPTLVYTVFCDWCSKSVSKNNFRIVVQFLNNSVVQYIIPNGTMIDHTNFQFDFLNDDHVNKYVIIFKNNNKSI
jgi:hypothetical protein